MMNGMVTTVQAATATSEDPCRGALAPGLVGKSIKIVDRQTARVNGKDVVTITLTLNDGTKVMALAPQQGNIKNLSNPGALLVVDKQGCQFLTV